MLTGIVVGTFAPRRAIENTKLPAAVPAAVAEL